MSKREKLRDIIVQCISRQRHLASDIDSKIACFLHPVLV